MSGEDSESFIVKQIQRAEEATSGWTRQQRMAAGIDPDPPGDVRAALASKDAEIERLQRQVGSLKAAFRVNMLRFGASDEDIDRVIGWAMEDAATRAAGATPQPRSEVSGRHTRKPFRRS